MPRQIARLNVRLELVKPILKMIAKRQEIVRERKEVRPIIPRPSGRLSFHLPDPNYPAPPGSLDPTLIIPFIWFTIPLCVYQMEELQKDSSRLTDRAGGKRVTEELMRLEKMQKRVKKDLPLLTDKLKKRLQDWEKAGA